MSGVRFQVSGVRFQVTFDDSYRRSMRWWLVATSHEGFMFRVSPVQFAEHDVYHAQDNNEIRNFLAYTHLFEGGNVDE